jgi:hypothetical protein
VTRAGVKGPAAGAAVEGAAGAVLDRDCDLVHGQLLGRQAGPDALRSPRQ